jgi:ZIP family zinc transporter
MLCVSLPYFAEERLHYILAFVGGIMAAVCVLELWPEARKCGNDRRLVMGLALGVVIMGWTLYVGV